MARLVSQEEIRDAPPLTLALDTSSKLTSLALSRGERILARYEAQLDEKRSERLWTIIRQTLADVGCKIDDVELYSACVGPGRFTGLRVGIAAVKGFAAATRRPVTGVSSLEAVACGKPARVVCSVLDAYRGDVYAQLFAFDSEGVPQPMSSPAVISAGGVAKLIGKTEGVVLVGDAAARAVAANDLSCDYYPRPSCLAEEVARLGWIKFRRGEYTTADELAALYVRPAEAEIKLALGLVGVKGRSRTGDGAVVADRG